MVFRFSDEERLVAQCCPADRDGYRRNCQGIAAPLIALRQQYEAGRYAAVDELQEFLNNRLMEHIAGKDAHDPSWVERAKADPQALALRAFSDLGHG